MNKIFSHGSFMEKKDLNRLQEKLVQSNAKQMGFTLVELMVIVSVIGILCAIAVPFIQETLRNIRIRSDAQHLLGSLQWAKGEAVRRNACMGVVFTTVDFPAMGGSYTIFVDDGGAGGGVQCNRTLDAGENVVAVNSVATDVSLSSAAIGAAKSLCFTANGVSCGSQSGNVQLRNILRWYRVTVTAAGGLRLQNSSDGVIW